MILDNQTELRETLYSSGYRMGYLQKLSGIKSRYRFSVVINGRKIAREDELWKLKNLMQLLEIKQQKISQALSMLPFDDDDIESGEERVWQEVYAALAKASKNKGKKKSK